MASYDDLAVGACQVTRARTICESDIVSWCAHTGDWFPLHSDAVYSETTMFGQRIAPGLMVLAYATGLGVPAESTTILANYGLDQVRFPKATFIGDTIHLRAEVIDKTRRDERSGVVAMRWDAVNQNGDTVCSSILKVLLARECA
jgi:acyl dehydratase